MKVRKYSRAKHIQMRLIPKGELVISFMSRIMDGVIHHPAFCDTFTVRIENLGMPYICRFYNQGCTLRIKKEDYTTEWEMAFHQSASEFGQRKRDGMEKKGKPDSKFIGDEQMELLDDCMSFPNLLVRVRRYRHCILRYLDENWVEQKMRMDDDMSELIQHEYDHLDGILATMRAIDNKSFGMKKQKEN